MSVPQPIQWYGGKGHLAPEILPIMNQCKFEKYVEPFCGGAAVLFAKVPTKLEVINDRDGLLVNFFLCLREYGEELVEKLILTPYSRDIYNLAKKSLAWHFDGEPNINRAVDLYVLTRQCMSGLIASGWSYGITHLPAYLSSIKNLPEAVERIRHVVIENDDAFNCLKKFDGPDTLFYCDPPYYPNTRSDTRYRFELTKGKHYDLLQLLNKLEGMVILSGYNCGIYETNLKDWGSKAIETVSFATPQTKVSGLQGEGGLKEGQARREYIWYNKAVQMHMAQLDWVAALNNTKGGR